MQLSAVLNFQEEAAVTQGLARVCVYTQWAGLHTDLQEGGSLSSVIFSLYNVGKVV